MKENTVVLSLEELDRLRDIEKTHKIMLEWWIRYEKVDCLNFTYFIQIYKREKGIEAIEEENDKIVNDYGKTIRILKEENKKLKKKRWFSF